MTSMARVRTSSSVVLLFLAVGCSRAPGPAPGEGVPREASASVAATEGAVDDPGAPARGELQWFRGNLHAHTNLCDHATSSPADVAGWYHQAGYDFLCLSEHELFIDPSDVELEGEAREELLLIRGAEFALPGDPHVHVISLGGRTYELVEGDETRVARLATCVREVRAGGGIPLLAHPKWLWSIRAGNVVRLTELGLFEVYSGQWHRKYSKPQHPSNDELWDAWLTAGGRAYGLAGDDSHRFGEFDFATPGKGWVMVRCRELSSDAVLAAVEAGEFYASSGVHLTELSLPSELAPGRDYALRADLGATREELRARRIEPELVPLPDGEPAPATGFRTEFIGPGGRVLHVVEGPRASFRIPEDAAYVRARVTYTWRAGSRVARCHAWCQPVFTDGR